MSQQLKQRLFPSSFVRAWVCRIYGKDPAPNTWVRWRQWAKVEKDSKLFTFEQLCFVSAIATIRATDEVLGRSPRRELHIQEIRGLADSLRIQEPIATVVQYLDATGTVTGYNAIDALRARGHQVSASTLYRSVPKFSIQKVYDVTYLERFVG